MAFTMADYGGYRLVHSLDFLCTQAHQQINLSIHIQQQLDLFWMLMPKKKPTLHISLLLLE
jgi:hypothetical protein